MKISLIKESLIIRKLLFYGSKNILGVLIRGTDYLKIKPINHPIQPSSDIVIHDIKKMDKKNKYNWIFLSTEDNIIRNKFIKEFGNKIKYLIPEKNIKYNQKTFLAFNPGIAGNLEYMRTYLISIIILSKCIDIITSRTNGAAAAFIIKNGFYRNSLIYYLGNY